MLVDAAALLRQTLPLNSIEHLDGRVCRKARPDARDGVRLRPLQQLTETRPVGLIDQARRPGLGPCDNQGVQGLGEEILDRP